VKWITRSSGVAAGGAALPADDDVRPRHPTSLSGLLAYASIIAAEEAYLRQKFGAQFDDYCRRVNRILPRLTGFREAIAGMRFNWRRLVTKEYNTFFWAIVHWLVNALAFWLGFKAVGIDVPFSAANFLQGIIAIGVALPSSPGFFGVFEAASRVGLEVYSVPGRQAVSWAIGFHVLSFIPITVMGLYYFARLGLHFSDFKTPPSDKQ